MYDNELIMYVDPDPVSYYDMFILMFSRWKLEQEDKVGEKIEWYREQLYEPFSVDIFIQDKILIEVEKGLFAIDDNFLSKKFFVSIDRMTAVYLYDILTRFTTLDKTNTFTTLSAANTVLGMYILFLSRSRVKAYKKDFNKIEFGLKTICNFLKMPYSVASKEMIITLLQFLQKTGLIAYSKNNTKYMCPYKLDKVLVSCSKGLMDIEQICQEYYETKDKA